MLEEGLAQLGLSTRECSIYVALLRFGVAPASRIAKDVGLPRQTVYSVLQKLVEGGLIEQSDRRGVRQFSADPDQLFRVLDQRTKKLAASKEMLKQEVAILLTKGHRPSALPVVQYYEGREGLKRLFRGILDLYQRGAEKTFRGYGINFFYPGLEEFLQRFVEKRHALGVQTRLFIARGPEGFGLEAGGPTLGRAIKRLDMEAQDAGIYLVGDRLYLFSYKDNVGVMVENRAVTKFLREVFDNHWQRVKEVD